MHAQTTAMRGVLVLKLTYAKYGSAGVLRRYHHSKFGEIETVTMWRDPGAHIIRIETERDREQWREIIDDLRKRQETA
jgi:hypothetical protein